MANWVAVSRAELHGLGMSEARKRVARVTRKTLNRSAILCPVDTNYLRSTGKANVGARGSTVVGRVEYTADYAAAVHEGRGPVTIRPKRAGGMLKFQVGGKTVHAKVVHQPARAGRPFLADALREVSAQESFRYTRTRA